MSDDSVPTAVEAGGSSKESDMTAYSALLLFGHSGTGKTMAAVAAADDLDFDFDAYWNGDSDDAPVGDPGVYLIACEPQAIKAARLANPQLRKDGAVLCTTYDKLQEQIRLAASGKLVELGFNRCVVDGVTEAQRIIKDNIVREVMAEIEASGESKKYRENWFDQDDWGYLKERTRRLCRALRMIVQHMDLVVTALEDEREDKDAGERLVLAKQEGTVGKELNQYFNAVGRLRKQPNGDKIDHVVEFKLPQRYLTKGFGPINGRQRPNVGAMLAVLNGKLPPSATRIKVVAAPPEPEPAVPPAAAPEEAAPRGRGPRIAS